MTTTFVLNGNTYTYPTDFIGADGYAYADNWEAFLGDLSAELQRTRGAGLTSSTAITPATGAQVFTTGQSATEVVIPDNALLIIEDAANAGKKMVGSVTSFTATTLTMNITYASDGGESPSEGSDWIIYYPSTNLIATLAALSSVADDDLFVVYDESAGVNKKITKINLATALLSGATLSGDLDFSGNKAKNAEIEGERWGVATSPNGTGSGAQSITRASGYEVVWTLDGDTTFVFETSMTGYSKLFDLTWAGSGGYAVAWELGAESPSTPPVWIGTEPDFTTYGVGGYALVSVMLTANGRFRASLVEQGSA